MPFVLRRVKSPALLALLMAVVAACNDGGSSSGVSTGPSSVSPTLATSSEVAPSRAACGADDLPETDLQGRVPRRDRDSGRSTQGYRCNLERIGQFQGEGATWVSASYKNCAYMATAFAGNLQKKLPGVQVIDVAQPGAPKFVKSLDSIAFDQGTWESLKVNEKRQLMAGTSVGPINHVLFFDVYDISGDCTQPRLLNGIAGKLTLPANLIGHEGGFSPDGNTYWSASANAGIFTAIDVSQPKTPRILYVGTSGLPNHGFSFSDDGNRMYLTTAAPAGVMILDTSQVQKRAPVPVVPPVAYISWNDGDISQHTIPVTYGGKPFLVTVDEFGTGATRFIDISDEKNPKIVSKLRLEIQQLAHADKRREDLTDNGLFGYEAHYCSVDRRVDPTAMACGYFQSGIRVFDVRDPLNPKEIAYYNPPAQAGKSALLPGSEHASPAGIGPSASDVRHQAVGLPPKPSLSPTMNTDWCSSPPRFVGNQLWVVCQDNGFQVLQFKNGVYPFAQ